MNIRIRREIRRLKDVEGFEFRFLFVNDGSKDRTLDVLEKFRQERNDVSYISFSRNFGQDAAIYAGLEHSKADYVISMDVDLQDNVSLLPEIVQKLGEGYDVVNPHRADRSESVLAASTARYSVAPMVRMVRSLPSRTLLTAPGAHSYSSAGTPPSWNSSPLP